MVVVAAAILSKQGKTLVSRQFVEISRPRIEGLLAAFPKLMGSDNTKRQHTFIETPSVRYVYQPIEDLYMIIITNKSSNILEDLDALHLLAKIVGDYCTRLQEEDVLHSAFDLIFAFDECFALGYKEKLTLRQIEENIEMDSHNERLHEIMQKNREREAEQQAKEVAERLERERKAGLARNVPSQVPSSSSVAEYEQYSRRPSKPDADSWGDKPAAAAAASSASSGGMKLTAGTKTNKDDAFLQQVAKQDASVKAAPKASSASASSAAASSGSSQAASAVAERKGVDFELIESISATIDKEGVVSTVQVRGELNILISDPAGQSSRIQLPESDSNFVFRAHPAVNKDAFKSCVLTPKDPATQPFPLNRKLPVITWKSKGKGEELVPLTVSCWPSAASETTTVVNMEFELQHRNRTLRNVQIRIPVPGKVAPVVQNCQGDYKFDARSKVLVWDVPQVDAGNADGSLEFIVAHFDSSDLFPIEVSFTSDSIVCNAVPISVVNQQGNVAFSARCTLSAEDYRIVEEAE